MINPTVESIFHYVLCYLSTGDYGNDYLSHMPSDIANLLESTFHLISLIVNPFI